MRKNIINTKYKIKQCTGSKGHDNEEKKIKTK